MKLQEPLVFSHKPNSSALIRDTYPPAPLVNQQGFTVIQVWHLGYLGSPEYKLPRRMATGARGHYAPSYCTHHHPGQTKQERGPREEHQAEKLKEGIPYSSLP